LRNVLRDVSAKAGFEYDVQVLPITVAALMTPQWIEKNLAVAAKSFSRVILPGYCQGDLAPIVHKLQSPVELGPKDLRQLPDFFGQSVPDRFGGYDIEIIAEINHAPRLELNQIVAEAKTLASDGADLIDVGCDPGYQWAGVADCVRALRQEGLRVSIDSFDHREVQSACEAGAELVLSVNQTNRDGATDWGAEVVAIPDTPEDLDSLRTTVEWLEKQKVPYRLDPILEPIGCGFSASLVRYAKTRDEFPAAEMMMGIGNLTELSDCDSAAMNLVLLGICQELQIRSVLTTQVINWARTSVRECDLARRLVHFSVNEGIPPKNVDPGLVLLRDSRPLEMTDGELQTLSEQIRDHNLRVFVQGGEFHLISSQLHLTGHDPFQLFATFLQEEHPSVKRMDAAHAFYLGYEMAKAMTALTLGKQYTQDEPLDWGFLTKPE